MWSGLPVLTRKGKSFISRVASSLLNAIGLNELITNTKKEYEELASELAKNPKHLKEIKNKLKKNRLAKPLFDTKLYAKNIESAYTKIYERTVEFVPWGGPCGGSKKGGKTKNSPLSKSAKHCVPQFASTHGSQPGVRLREL